MLDDLKYIHKRDAQDALGIAQNQWQQLQYKFTIEASPPRQIDNVVLAGMGGSALPGLFVTSWPKLNVPYEIVRNYDIPEYVNSKTLFIASSYSGNTEETISALHSAIEKNAQIVVLTAGGQLKDIAKKANYPVLELPSGIQPRMSTFYFLRALCETFIWAGLRDASIREELEKSADWLASVTKSWSADVPTAKNTAKRIALDIVGKTVIIYSGPNLAPVANKWKISINENAKNLAWWNVLPEFNHNEFIGWSSHPIDKPFAVIEILSDLENPRINKRFVVTKKMLSGKIPAPITVQCSGESNLQNILWGVVLGDFTSIYLALLNGLNPTPVDLVEKFKKALNE